MEEIKNPIPAASQSGTMWQERPATRWASHKLRDMLLRVNFGGDPEDVESVQVLVSKHKEDASRPGANKKGLRIKSKNLPVLSPRSAGNVLGRDVVGRHILAGLISNVEVEGDACALVPRGRTSAAYLFHEMKLTIRFEIALVDEANGRNICQTVNTARRSAEEMIAAAARVEGAKAPMTFAEDGVFRGTFTIEDFTSEEEEVEIEWELHDSEYGTRVGNRARLVAETMKERVLDCLSQFGSIFREEFVDKRIKFDADVQAAKEDSHQQ